MQRKVKFRYLRPRPRPGGRGRGRLPALPRPVRLALVHALVTFASLLLLPHHPVSLPTAAGLGFAAMFYVQMARRRERDSDAEA